MAQLILSPPKGGGGVFFGGIREFLSTKMPCQPAQKMPGSLRIMGSQNYWFGDPNEPS